LRNRRYHPTLNADDQLAFTGYRLATFLHGGDHFQIAHVVGHHWPLGVGACVAGYKHPGMALHDPGIFHIFELLRFLVEGLNRPGRRYDTDSVRGFTILAQAPGLGIETTLYLLCGAAVATNTGHRIIGYHSYLA